MIKTSIFAVALSLAAALLAVSQIAAARVSNTETSASGEEGEQLSLQNQAVVRCSAAFAMVSYGQSNGNADALKWPKLGDRGKEFFVRALAGLIDDTGKSREEISQLVSAEAQRLWDSGTVHDVMPGCLLMLETSNL